MVEERQQRRVVALDVEQAAGLLVQAELRPGEDLAELLERAEAAGQRDEAVREIGHALLALVHRGGDDQFGQAVVGQLLAPQPLRDDADRLSAGRKHRLGHRAHHANAAAAEDKGDAASRRTAGRPHARRRDTPGRFLGWSRRRRRSVPADAKRLVFHRLSCLAPRPFRTGPGSSQRSTCSNRSVPQNGSPSTNTNGEPNTPRSMADWVCVFRRSLIAGSLSAASSAVASTPRPLEHLGGGLRAGDVLAVHEVGAIQRQHRGLDLLRRPLLQPADGARRGLRCDGEGIGHLERNTMEARRARHVPQSVVALERQARQRPAAGHLENGAQQHRLPLHATAVPRRERGDARRGDVAVG